MFNLKPKKSEKYFLGLFLKESQGVMLVIKDDNDHLTIVDKENFSYSNGWENITEDIDDILYRIEKNRKIIFKETIFFLYSHFLDEKNNDIKKPYLQKIKSIVSDLQLTAIGYIEVYEAVLQTIEKKEQIPLTAILLEIDSNQMTTFVYRGGKKDYQKTIARTDDICQDLLICLDEIKSRSMLPARIVMYNSHDLDHEVSSILSYQWGEEYFVQMPKTDILLDEEIINGLVLVFSRQLKTNTNDSNLNTTNHNPKNQSNDADMIMGFAINQDISVMAKPPEYKRSSINYLSVFFKKVKSLWSFNKPNFKMNIKFNLSSSWVLIVGILLIITSLTINEFLFHKANLTVYLPSYKISRDIDILIDYKFATSSVNLNQEMATTGKKEIGDPAKGVVTLHNFDDKEVIFAKNTELVSNNLKFLLDQEVKVASSSIASDGSAKLPGKANGTITASFIGPEGNLGKGQRFTINNYSSSVNFAINNDILKGGVKRSVKTVSSNDIEKLKSLVLERSKSSLKTPNSLRGYEIISELSKTFISKISLNKEVGEESEKVSINATVSSEFYGIVKKDFFQQIDDLIKKEIKPGYTIKTDKLIYKDKGTTIKKNKINMMAEIEFNLVKNISENELKKIVIGKNQNKLKDLLKEKYSIDDYDLTIDQPIIIFNNYVPLIKDNINIVFSQI